MPVPVQSPRVGFPALCGVIPAKAGIHQMDVGIRGHDKDTSQLAASWFICDFPAQVR